MADQVWAELILLDRIAETMTAVVVVVLASMVELEKQTCSLGQQVAGAFIQIYKSLLG